MDKYFLELIGETDELARYDEKSHYEMFETLSYEAIKWYEWESDMAEFSKDFPESWFVLYGEGEERDDMWKAMIHNGHVKVSYAHIYYDDYAPEGDFE